eukprot:gb/GECG01010778.1/.p1 GENE.gb/GECG01010778.1/~~gb/GECG01010778.1/.p1  ORF type:complete len:565 (+),score=95.44 gb/GECG01010778.1/:1-1695(+)
MAKQEETRTPQPPLRLRFNAFFEEFVDDVKPDTGENGFSMLALENGATVKGSTGASQGRQGLFIVIDGPQGAWTSELAEAEDEKTWSDQVVELDALCHSLSQLLTVRIWETFDGETSILVGENVVRILDLLMNSDNFPLDVSVATGGVCERVSKGVVHFSHSNILDKHFESVFNQLNLENTNDVLKHISLSPPTENGAVADMNGDSPHTLQLSNHEDLDLHIDIETLPKQTTIAEALGRARREIKLRQAISHEKRDLDSRVVELEKSLQRVESEKLKLEREYQELQEALSEYHRKSTNPMESPDVLKLLSLYADVLSCLKDELGEELLQRTVSKYMVAEPSTIQRLASSAPTNDDFQRLCKVTDSYKKEGDCPGDASPKIKQRLEELESQVEQLQSSLTDEKEAETYWQQQCNKKTASLGSFRYAVKNQVNAIYGKFEKTKREWERARRRVNDIFNIQKEAIASRVERCQQLCTDIQEWQKQFISHEEFKKQIESLRGEVSEVRQRKSQELRSYESELKELREANRQKDDLIAQWEAYAAHWEERGREAEKKVKELGSPTPENA